MGDFPDAAVGQLHLAPLKNFFLVTGLGADSGLLPGSAVKWQVPCSGTKEGAAGDFS